MYDFEIMDAKYKGKFKERYWTAYLSKSEKKKGIYVYYDPEKDKIHELKPEYVGDFVLGMTDLKKIWLLPDGKLDYRIKGHVIAHEKKHKEFARKFPELTGNEEAVDYAAKERTANYN